MRAFPFAMIRCWTLHLAGVALLLLVAAGVARAQTDVIRGRVTTTQGEPLLGARVVATSMPGNLTREARTNNQGNFQIVFPGGGGDYLLSYSLFGYTTRQLQLRRVSDEDLLIADARLSVMQIDTLNVTATRAQRVPRNERGPAVGGSEQTINTATLPLEQQGSLAALAASLPGVLLLPGLEGEADGFSMYGLAVDQNSVTLNGMPAGAGVLPRDAAVGASLSGSPFDVSRGGFSGGNLNLAPRRGSNFQSRGVSLMSTTPQLQWTDRAAQALGAEHTNVSLSGMASGPIRLNQSFYNVSYQLGRQSNPNQTLLTTSELGLRTAGIAVDSVARLHAILQHGGVPVFAGPSGAERIGDSGAIFGSVDVAPTGSASGQAFGLTFQGNWRRQTSVGGSATHLATTAGERTSLSGGVQARHSGYFGHVLSESGAGVSHSRNEGRPYLDLPGGRVRVSSAFAEGGGSVQSLGFGGASWLNSSSNSVQTTLQNSLAWFDNANRHRVKLSTELQLATDAQTQGSNLLGTFHFDSLEDLEAGLPSSFSRTLTRRERSAGLASTAVGLGDRYRHSDRLSLEYGVRIDGARYTTAPAYNARIEELFGRRNDEMPKVLELSPRLGFTWAIGRAPEVAAFQGAAQRPRALVQGGIGVFVNSLSPGEIGAALDNTGLPGGVQQIACVGPRAPVPEWARYALDPSTVPDGCADGTAGSVFASSAPSATLYATDFAPQRSVRSELSWSGNVLDGRFSLSARGTYSLNQNQRRAVDLNLDARPRFTLADDGRPVYVDLTGIVARTGAVASRASRVSQDFARVTELRSDLASRSAQLNLSLSPLQRVQRSFGWGASYTYGHIREQVGGFASTAGDPFSVEWARSAQGPHQVGYSLRYNLFDALLLSWTGRFQSGRSFTPMIAGDVNGDGHFNDRAFVPSPDAAGDAALASGMRQLLDGADAGTRACLQRQLGVIAEQNSCRGPWSSSASLNASLGRAKMRLPPRAAVSFSLSNPLGAADLLLHGSQGLRGWGQSPAQDNQLLYVRGFDDATRQYRYEVNERFGQSRPQFVAFRQPVTLSISARYDLGPLRERQTLVQQLRMGRTQPGARVPEQMLRSMGTFAIPNPLSTILRSQDSLRLSVPAADSIASMNRRYVYQVDSLWVPAAHELATLPERFAERAAYTRYLEARRAQIDLLMEIGPAVRALLTEEQRRKLPGSVLSHLDPRFLAFVRDGAAMYVAGGGGMPVPLSFGSSAEPATMIIR